MSNGVENDHQAKLRKLDKCCLLLAGPVEYVWLWLALALILITVGCGGARNNLRAMRRARTIALDEDQEDSRAGELNAKHLEELYAKSGIKDRDRSIEEELKKWSHQSNIDFPIQMNKQVRAYIVYFATERKGFTTRSLARSSRYLPMIKEVFREYGLPEDLAYLAMVESGFNPNACSPAGACGMWQFIKGTGLRYGLVINGNVDERRNPEKSTRAAAEYLLDLYKQFGSWYLAAASYNCGEGRVQKELRKSNYKNFWELSANKCIPGETRNYVPQMIAATIIARNPNKFGFGNVPYQPPLTPLANPISRWRRLKPRHTAFSPPVRRCQTTQGSSGLNDPCPSAAHRSQGSKENHPVRQRASLNQPTARSAPVIGNPPPSKPAAPGRPRTWLPCSASLTPVTKTPWPVPKKLVRPASPGALPNRKNLSPARPSWPKSTDRNPPAWHKSKAVIRQNHPGAGLKLSRRPYWSPRPDELQGARFYPGKPARQKEYELKAPY